MNLSILSATLSGAFTMFTNVIERVMEVTESRIS